MIDPEVEVAIKTIRETLPKVTLIRPNVAWHVEQSLSSLEHVLREES